MYRDSRLYSALKRIPISEKLGFYVGLLVLFATSCLVGYQGAVVHAFNYDQSIVSYLFDSVESFAGAILPVEHTFMLKWPVFAIGGVAGNSHLVFILLTMALYVTTVFGFLAIIHYVAGKRYMVTALISYLLTVLLLLIPAQQSPGDVMPVNMAMITTRNIEYVLYILFCYFLIKSKRLFDRDGTLAFLLILLLTISDTLLFYIAALTAVLSVGYQVIITKKITNSRIPMLLYVGMAYIASAIIIRLINMLDTVSINTKSASISTTTQDSVRSMFHTTLDAVEAVMRNFGADIFGDQLSPSLLIGVVGMAFFAACMYAMARLMLKRAQGAKGDTWDHVGELLVLSAVAALLLYVGIARGDGLAVRYLGIFFFAGVFALALWIRSLRRRQLTAIYPKAAMVILLFLPFAVVFSIHTTNVSVEKMSSVFGIKDSGYIASTLDEEGIDLFVAMYYVSILTRYESNNTIKSVPIPDYGCIPALKNYLTSMPWHRPDDSTQNSALYVIDDHNDEGTINNGCPSERLESKLGKPSRVISVPDSPAKIYIYDYDIRSKLF